MAWSISSLNSQKKALKLLNYQFFVHNVNVAIVLFLLLIAILLFLGSWSTVSSKNKHSMLFPSPPENICEIKSDVISPDKKPPTEYSRTFRKRPPKMSSLGGRLRELRP